MSSEFRKKSFGKHFGKYSALNINKYGTSLKKCSLSAGAKETLKRMLWKKEVSSINKIIKYRCSNTNCFQRTEWMISQNAEMAFISHVYLNVSSYSMFLKWTQSTVYIIDWIAKRGDRKIHVALREVYLHQLVHNTYH